MSKNNEQLDSEFKEKLLNNLHKNIQHPKNLYDFIFSGEEEYQFFIKKINTFDSVNIFKFLMLDEKAFSHNEEQIKKFLNTVGKNTDFINELSKSKNEIYHYFKDKPADINKEMLPILNKVFNNEIQNTMKYIDTINDSYSFIDKLKFNLKLRTYDGNNTVMKFAKSVKNNLFNEDKFEELYFLYSRLEYDVVENNNYNKSLNDFMIKLLAAQVSNNSHIDKKLLDFNNYLLLNANKKECELVLNQIKDKPVSFNVFDKNEIFTLNQKPLEMVRNQAAQIMRSRHFFKEINLNKEKNLLENIGSVIRPKR